MTLTRKGCMIGTLLLVFAAMESSLDAQTDEPSTVDVTSSAEVQPDSAETQSSSDDPEQKQQTLTSVKDKARAADVENERRLNDLRGELLDHRAKNVDWWLSATDIFLTLLCVAVAILTYIGFKRRDKTGREARENKESGKHAEEAQRFVEEIKAYRDEADSLIKKMNAEVVKCDPQKAGEIVENVHRNPESTPIDRMVAAALSLQQRNRIQEAIEKWESIANSVAGSDNELEARAWFSVGYLTFLKKGVKKPDLEMAINAYDNALRLNPDLVEAYNNRGLTNVALGQYEAAFADYDAAIARNPDYVETYNNRGLAKVSLGQYKAAIADYDAAIARNPASATVYNNRGVAKVALGQFEAASADYDAAIARKPRSC